MNSLFIIVFSCVVGQTPSLSGPSMLNTCVSQIEIVKTEAEVLERFKTPYRPTRVIEYNIKTEVSQDINIEPVTNYKLKRK